jgi:hypothetical protein
MAEAGVDVSDRTLSRTPRWSRFIGWGERGNPDAAEAWACGREKPDGPKLPGGIVIRGKGYEGVLAMGAGVMPPRIVFPDSVDVLVKAEVG